MSINLNLLRGKMGSTKTRNPESENGNGIMETETEHGTRNQILMIVN